MKHKGKILIGVLVISILLNGYFIFAKPGTASSPQKESFEDLVEKYPLLSKRILAEVPNDYLVNFVDLRNQLRTTVAPYSDKFAFYFEYLPTGTSIGVNEKDEFTAASLLKVPVVMANLLLEEIEGEDSMPDTITLTEDMINSNYGSLWKRGAGGIVTRDEAIKYALEESDNTAIDALISITDYKYFQRVHDGLDIELKDVQDTPVITTKNYSSILRALYFASVVDKEDSQRILSHLSKSVHDKMLSAGVPESVEVANKVGVVDGELYTDCGIVYVPRRPYLLCMLSVSDEATALARMSEISKMTYDFVSNVNQEMPSGVSE